MPIDKFQIRIRKSPKKEVISNFLFPPPYFRERIRALEITEEANEQETDLNSDFLNFCALCNSNGKEPAIFSLRKTEKDHHKERFYIWTRKIKVHKTKVGKVPLCEKCHFFYHNFQNFEIDAKIEELIDLMSKERDIKIDFSHKWTKNIPKKIKKCLSEAEEVISSME